MYVHPEVPAQASYHLQNGLMYDHHQAPIPESSIENVMNERDGNKYDRGSNIVDLIPVPPTTAQDNGSDLPDDLKSLLFSIQWMKIMFSITDNIKIPLVMIFTAMMNIVISDFSMDDFIRDFPNSANLESDYSGTDLCTFWFQTETGKFESQTGNKVGQSDFAEASANRETSQTEA